MRLHKYEQEYQKVYILQAQTNLYSSARRPRYEPKIFLLLVTNNNFLLNFFYIDIPDPLTKALVRRSDFNATV